MSACLAIGCPCCPLKYLDLEAEQGQRLFYVNHWPRKFREAYHRLDSERDSVAYDGDAMEPKERRKYASLSAKMAKVAAARIEFFIKTKGTDRLSKKK